MKKTIAFAVLAVLLISASNNSKKQDKNTIKALNTNYSFIPAGTALLDSTELSYQSFIMLKEEVDNFDYSVFLNDLKSKGELEKLKIAQVDSALWSQGKNSMALYEDYYHAHPAYRHYPVVNVTKEGAELFCEWLTEKINQSLPEGQKLKFRLPTKLEWMQAARGGLELSPYSWGGPYVRNSEGQTLGNFLQLDASNITRDENNEYKVVIHDFHHSAPGSLSADILAPTKSYWPNGYGLYNMCGNTAELLSDVDEVIGGSWRDPGFDVRIESVKKYKGAAPTIGFRVVATVEPDKMEWLKIKKKR